MIKYDSKTWDAHDPDGLLSATDADAAARRVHPREDVLQLTHKRNGTIVDLGFYEGIERWVVSLVRDNDWDEPELRQEHAEFIAAMHVVETLLNHHATDDLRAHADDDRGSSPTLQSAAKFLWPRFVVEWDAVLLGDFKSGTRNEPFDSVTEAEILLNHVHVLDLFEHGASLDKEPWWNNEHPDFEAACSLAKAAVESWSAKLRTEFPDRCFRVYYTRDDNPVVRFHQVRDGEPSYLDEADWIDEVQTGNIIIKNVGNSNSASGFRDWLSPHIVEMVREGALEPASDVQLDAANRAAEAVPWHWVGTRVEWEQLGTKVELDVNEPVSALEDTVLGRRTKLLFMFDDKSGVVGAAATVWSRLDEIAWRAPGQRFVFGVEENGTLDPNAVGMLSEGTAFVVTTLRDERPVSR